MLDGFSVDDFDAYLPDKWGSNMFTLPRRRVKEKLERLSRHLAPVLESANIGLRAHLSDDHPSLWNNKKVDTQWLFFSRDEAAERVLAEVIDLERTLAATLADPTPLFRHAFLGVAVRRDGLDTGLWLHHDAWVDRKNLVSLIANSAGRDRFRALLGDLPEETVVGLADGEMVRACDLDAERLSALLRDFEEKKGWIFAGVRMPRDAVVPLGVDIASKVAGLFEKLVPFYAAVAWSKENDAISIDGVVTQRRLEIEAAEAEIDRERLEREEKRRVLDEERRKLREETEERARAEALWRERERAIRRAAVRSLGPEGDAAPAADAPPPAEKREHAPVAAADKTAAPRPAAPARPQPPKAQPKAQEPVPAKVSEERKADVRVGDEVVVSRGFHKRRSGVVQSIEEKGDLKVAFGSLTARVPRADVEGQGPRVAQGEADRRAQRPRKS